MTTSSSLKPPSASSVPLEPFPAPPFQAIDAQGYEYPPRVVPSAQTFEAMVRRLDLVHHATKKRRRGPLGRGSSSSSLGTAAAGATSPTAAAEKDLAAALESVEEAMQDLLIAADLVHVVREERSFIGQDSLTESQGPGGARGASLPVAYIAPEVVLEMKKQSLAEAASDMAAWVQRTRTTLDKGRRLIGAVAGLRRISRLRAGGRNVALTRPLSAGDPISVVFDTKNGQVVLPFELDVDGTPRIPGYDDDEYNTTAGPATLLRVRILEGGDHGNNSASSSLLLRQQDHPGRGLAMRVQGLEDEAYLGRLFEALRREVASPAQVWLDRHGVMVEGGRGGGLGKDQSLNGAQSDQEGVRPLGAPLQVVEASGQHVLVEVDHLHDLAIEFGEGSSNGATRSSSMTPSPLLQRMSTLALLRVLELGGQRLGKQEEGGILSRVSQELAHRQFVERLLERVARVVRKARDNGPAVPVAVETVRWIDYPLTAPAARLVLLGRRGQPQQQEETFQADVRVEVTSLAVTWTATTRAGGKTHACTSHAQELARLDDLETYLECRLGLRPIKGQEEGPEMS